MEIKMSFVKSEFKLVGSGEFPMSQRDFESAAGVDYASFGISVMAGNYEVRTLGRTAEQVAEDIKKVADRYGKKLEGLTIK